MSTYNQRNFEYKFLNNEIFVFHSGVHHKKANCEPTTVIAKVQNVLKTARPNLFPSDLTLTVAVVSKKTKLRKGNGGWGDVRDHELCYNMSMQHRRYPSSGYGMGTSDYQVSSS